MRMHKLLTGFFEGNIMIIAVDNGWTKVVNPIEACLDI